MTLKPQIRDLSVVTFALCAVLGLSACSADSASLISQDAAITDHQALYDDFLQLVDGEFAPVEFSNLWEGTPSPRNCADDGSTARYSNIPNARFSSELTPQEVADFLVGAYDDSGIELTATRVDDDEAEHAGDFTFESDLRGTTALGTEIWIEVYGVQADDYNVAVFLHSDTRCFPVQEDSD